MLIDLIAVIYASDGLMEAAGVLALALAFAAGITGAAAITWLRESAARIDPTARDDA